MNARWWGVCLFGVFFRSKIFRSSNFLLYSAYLVETRGIQRMIQVGRILRSISSPVSCPMSPVRSDQVVEGFLQSLKTSKDGVHKVWQLVTFSHQKAKEGLIILEKWEF